MHHYYEIENLNDFYFEDSYVLDIYEHENEIIFKIEAVIVEDSPYYNSPKPNEQYCYRNILLSFSKVKKIEWTEKRMTPIKGIDDEVDYGNIEVFTFSGQTYYLEGEWGEVKIQSEYPPNVKFI